MSGDFGVTATAINNENDVAGFATNSAGTTEGFLRRSDGKVFHLAASELPAESGCSPRPSRS